ncbi:MAG: chemotaxis-specific protein-glutamate methyltransferase CheB [Cyanophyceae cyanobacterium]
MSQATIRVLLVEDSPVALNILHKLLDASDEIQVAGTASNGKEALNLIPKVRPTVICTALYMPGMDGVELTKQVMARYPCPILVLSNDGSRNFQSSARKSFGSGSEEAENAFELLQAGALDVFPLPTSGILADYEPLKRQLIAKLKVLAGVRVFTKTQKQAASAVSGASSAVSASPIVPSRANPAIKVIAIGASTGGPKALRQILCPLSAKFPAAILCTQHISIGFLPGLVNWLASECQLRVKIAQARELPVPGTVYFAPDHCHLALDSLGRFLHTVGEPVDGHRPSVTVMFRAVARFYGSAAAGILLTGMGRDGAAGMQAIAAAGGTTIAQDQASCVVFGMPKAAIALGAAQQTLSLNAIAPWLLRTVSP